MGMRLAVTRDARAVGPAGGRVPKVLDTTPTTLDPDTLGADGEHAQ
mgnify:CR=1 FL=1